MANAVHALSGAVLLLERDLEKQREKLDELSRELRHVEGSMQASRASSGGTTAHRNTIPRGPRSLSSCLESCGVAKARDAIRKMIQLIQAADRTPPNPSVRIMSTERSSSCSQWSEMISTFGIGS